MPDRTEPNEQADVKTLSYPPLLTPQGTLPYMVRKYKTRIPTHRTSIYPGEIFFVEFLSNGHQPSEN